MKVPNSTIQFAQGQTKKFSEKLEPKERKLAILFIHFNDKAIQCLDKLMHTHCKITIKPTQ